MSVISRFSAGLRLRLRSGDAIHVWENAEKERPFNGFYNPQDAYESIRRLKMLAAVVPSEAGITQATSPLTEDSTRLRGRVRPVPWAASESVDEARQPLRVPERRS